MVAIVAGVGLSMNCWISLIIAFAMSGELSRSMNWATFLHLAISATDFFWMSLYVGATSPFAMPTSQWSVCRKFASASAVPMYSRIFLAASLFVPFFGMMKPSVGASM